MFGSDFELSAYMMLDQLLQKLLALVIHQIVKAYARAYKDFLYPLYLPKRFQQIYILAVVDFQRRTRRVTNTGFILAHSHGLLFFAGWVSKIRRRSPHVVDIALEILIGYKALCLSDDVFFAALLNYAPLVKRNSAIVARSETPSHGSQRIFDLFYRRHSPRIAGVKSPLVRQVVYFVHFVDRQRKLHWILHKIFISLLLQKRLAIIRIVVGILRIKRLHVLRLVFAYVVV